MLCSFALQDLRRSPISPAAIFLAMKLESDQMKAILAIDTLALSDWPCFSFTAVFLFNVLWASSVRPADLVPSCCDFACLYFFGWTLRKVAAGMA